MNTVKRVMMRAPAICVAGENSERMNIARRSRNNAATWLVFLLAAVLLSRPATAQVVRVALRDSVSGALVVGALVSAIDPSGESRADAISNELGVATLRVPSAGVWALRVRRIGLSPLLISDVRVAEKALTTVPLNIVASRQPLAAVRVTADGGTCGHAPSGADRAGVLWEQISLALRVSMLTQHDTNSAPLLQIAEHVRDLDPSMVERAVRVTRTGIGASRPYTADNPDSLAVLGYVRRTPDGEFKFFAPDETVLLSEAFARTHCFATPKSDEDPSLAELHFRPAHGRSIADVEGTVYVDTLSGELRRIEFLYVVSQSLLPTNARHAGGDVSLLHLQNGQWIVASWAIRVPLFARIGATPRFLLRGYQETGGIVDPTDARPPDE
jgi:hypothetical protein